MYQNIMVPLDGSPLAECVLPHVESLARGCQAKNVVFVRVVEPVYLPSGADYAFSERDRARLESEHTREAENYLKELTAKIKYDPVKLSWRILKGKAADALIEYSNKNEVDLIIIATHGRSGVSRWVWGSIADRLLRAACGPVLMIRSPGCVPGI